MYSFDPLEEYSDFLLLHRDEFLNAYSFISLLPPFARLYGMWLSNPDIRAYLGLVPDFYINANLEYSIRFLKERFASERYLRHNWLFHILQSDDYMDHRGDFYDDFVDISKGNLDLISFDLPNVKPYISYSQNRIIANNLCRETLHLGNMSNHLNQWSNSYDVTRSVNHYKLDVNEHILNRADRKSFSIFNFTANDLKQAISRIIDKQIKDINDSLSICALQSYDCIKAFFNWPKR
jgi:hypothetical protein